jgi:hypothetical protein
MATVTESDIQELKDLINSQFVSLYKEINDLKGTVGKIEATLQGQQTLIQKIPDLAEKVGELKNWKQVGLVIITAFISSVASGLLGGVIGWLIRGVKV